MKLDPLFETPANRTSRLSVLFETLTDGAMRLNALFETPANRPQSLKILFETLPDRGSRLDAQFERAAKSTFLGSSAWK